MNGNFGIKKAREDKNISAIELANKLNVDIAVINAWEIGIGTIPLNTIIKMTKLLNVTSEQLLFSEERKALNISQLTDKQKDIVIKLYEIIRDGKKE